MHRPTQRPFDTQPERVRGIRLPVRQVGRARRTGRGAQPGHDLIGVRVGGHHLEDVHFRADLHVAPVDA